MKRSRGEELDLDIDNVFALFLLTCDRKEGRKNVRQQSTQGERKQQVDYQAKTKHTKNRWMMQKRERYMDRA